MGKRERNQKTGSRWKWSGRCSSRMDQDSGEETGTGRVRAFKELRRHPPRKSRRPGGGCYRCIKSHPKRQDRLKRSKASHRFFLILRTYRCGKNGTFKGTGRSHVRYRKFPDQGRYVWVHGKAQCFQDDRFPARICRLWGGWTAQWKSAQKSLQRDPVWWDRKGPSGCI